MGRAAPFAHSGFRGAIWLTLVLCVAPISDALHARDLSSQQAARIQLLVRAADCTRTQPLQVEVADSRIERNRGLMNRRELAPRSGMLFLWEREGYHSMWMKKTYISLDMLFIDKDGVITQISRRAQPLSLSSIVAQEPALAVLEIGGGQAEQLNIREGDYVLHSHFGNTNHCHPVRDGT